MSNPTKEECVRKLFEEGETIILAGGSRRAIPTREAIIEVIRQAEEAAWLKGHDEAADKMQKIAQEMIEENEAIERDTIPTAEVPAPQASPDPIHVSILMNVDQDKAKGSLMLHDWLDVEGLEFKEAVGLFGEWFSRLQKSLHAIGPHPIPPSKV